MSAQALVWAETELSAISAQQHALQTRKTILRAEITRLRLALSAAEAHTYEVLKKEEQL